jgi:hypothetical protein
VKTVSDRCGSDGRADPPDRRQRLIVEIILAAMAVAATTSRFTAAFFAGTLSRRGRRA